MKITKILYIHIKMSQVEPKQEATALGNVVGLIGDRLHQHDLSRGAFIEKLKKMCTNAIEEIATMESERANEVEGVLLLGQYMRGEKYNIFSHIRGP